MLDLAVRGVYDKEGGSYLAAQDLTVVILYSWKHLSIILTIFFRMFPFVSFFRGPRGFPHDRIRKKTLRYFTVHEDEENGYGS